MNNDKKAPQTGTNETDTNKIFTLKSIKNNLVSILILLVLTVIIGVAANAINSNITDYLEENLVDSIDKFDELIKVYENESPALTKPTPEMLKLLEKEEAISIDTSNIRKLVQDVYETDAKFIKSIHKHDVIDEVDGKTVTKPFYEFHIFEGHQAIAKDYSNISDTIEDKYKFNIRAYPIQGKEITMLVYDVFKNEDEIYKAKLSRELMIIHRENDSNPWKIKYFFIEHQDILHDIHHYH